MKAYHIQRTTLRHISLKLCLGLVLMLSLVTINWSTTPPAQAASNVKVKVIIERVKELECHDEIETPFGNICTDSPDYYTKIYIDGQKVLQTGRDDYSNKKEIFPNWQGELFVNLSKESIPIVIEIWDSDDTSGDDRSDLHSGPGRSLNLNLDLKYCYLSGDDFGWCSTSTSDPLISSGTSDDRSEIQYRVEVSGQLDRPRNIRATDGTSMNQIEVTWDKVAGATNYEVWRSTSNNSSTAIRVASSITIQKFTDTNINSGMTYYYYWVKAKNWRYTTSEFGSSNSGYVIAKPNNVRATDGEFTDQIKVTWNNVHGAKTYEVWRNISNNASTATRIASSVTTRTYIDKDITPGTSYYYWIKGKSDSKTTNFSNSDPGYALIVTYPVYLPLISK